MKTIDSTNFYHAIIFMVLIPSVAKSAPIDKSAFNLFNPTPDNQLRELSSDRPDATEGPTTVDAGHFQLETDVYNRTEDKIKIGDIKNTAYEVATSNLRIGLTDRFELDLIASPYLYSKVETGGISKKIEGAGDSMVRMKYNFIGNDGGPYAIGLLPFVKLPTAKDGLGNDKYEGGVILPIALELPNQWNFGMMFEIDYLKDDAKNGFHNNFITSATLAHSLVGELEGYVEFFSETSGDAGAEWNATIDVGVTYSVNSNFQLDAGVNVGITEAADDLNPFVGITARM